MAKTQLTVDLLKAEAKIFANAESQHNEPTLYGASDGKAVGTYLEHKFRRHLESDYEFEQGNSASGIDFPCIDVDLKVTSIKQPQSSCPFKSARQKIFGLGYHLLVFVYDKTDDHTNATSQLDIQHTFFVQREQTADFQTTKGLRDIVANNGNEEDIMAFLSDRNLPVDDIEASAIAKKVLVAPPEIGYLTISNALQWRLQYKRLIDVAGKVAGVSKIL
jgi:hypothetical protein